MRRHIRRPTAIVLALAALVGLQATTVVSGQEGFRFRSGVELINVTATVVDRTGRFLPGLTKDDFVIYEDNQPVEITHFSAERTPVSLGIVLDTSGSMQGQKWNAARDAIDRFLQQLSDPADEFFLYRFSASPDLVQDWTNDRRALSWSLGRVNPNGGTAMYDGVAEAVPMAHAGRNRKKAIVIISDGNDTSSRVGCWRSAPDGPRERGARLRGRHRWQRHPHHHEPAAPAGRWRASLSDPLPHPGRWGTGRRQLPAVPGWGWRRRLLVRTRRPGERGRTAADHRREWRPNRDRERPAGSRIPPRRRLPTS